MDACENWVDEQLDRACGGKLRSRAGESLEQQFGHPGPAALLQGQAVLGRAPVERDAGMAEPEGGLKSECLQDGDTLGIPALPKVRIHVLGAAMNPGAELSDGGSGEIGELRMSLTREQADLAALDAELPASPAPGSGSALGDLMRRETAARHGEQVHATLEALAAEQKAAAPRPDLLLGYAQALRSYSERLAGPEATDGDRAVSAALARAAAAATGRAAVLLAGDELESALTEAFQTVRNWG